MLLLTHPNVMVRPSNSSEMNPSTTNFTSIDATKPNANVSTLLKKMFFALNSFQASPTLYEIIYLVRTQNFLKK